MRCPLRIRDVWWGAGLSSTGATAGLPATDAATTTGLPTTTAGNLRGPSADDNVGTATASDVRTAVREISGDWTTGIPTGSASSPV